MSSLDKCPKKSYTSHPGNHSPLPVRDLRGRVGSVRRSRNTPEAVDSTGPSSTSGDGCSVSWCLRRHRPGPTLHRRDMEGRSDVIGSTCGTHPRGGKTFLHPDPPSLRVPVTSRPLLVLNRGLPASSVSGPPRRTEKSPGTRTWTVTTEAST